MVAAACITPDLQHLVSVGGDGCMIVWRLPEPLVQAMSTAAAQVAVALAKTDSVLAKVEGAEAAVAAAAVATPPPRRKWGPAQDPITPEQAAAAAAATAAAGELAGESGDGIGPDMPTWIRRAQEGRSILSTTKLPKWARALATPSVDEGSSISSMTGASSSIGATEASSAVAAGGKWGKQLEDKLVIYNEKGTPVVFKVGAGVLHHTCINSLPCPSPVMVWYVQAITQGCMCVPNGGHCMLLSPSTSRASAVCR
jgi:hypothetical protein